MAEQVYEKAAVKREVMAHLRQAQGHQTTGRVTLATKFPFWAVAPVLEEMYVAKEVLFTAGVGWQLVPTLVAPVAA